MEPIFVRVQLFDPVTEETFPVEEGLSVSIARLDPETRRVDRDRYPFVWSEEHRAFTTHTAGYEATREHYLCVTFDKRNFSKTKKALLSLEEADAADETLWAPTRLPTWDTGWDDKYRTNEYFGRIGKQPGTDPSDPIVLKVPIRRLFVIGHRGAPHKYPENTLASLQEALDMGANALEFDLCLNADGNIAVFHDSQPTKQPPRVDRTNFEKLPFELISPEFNFTGRKATFYAVEDGEVVEKREEGLSKKNELDLVNLTFPQTRDAYRYPPVDGTEHRVIDFTRFLEFCAENVDRLRLIFFDVKPPGDLADPRPAKDYGRRIAETLKKFPKLPELMVVAYADVKVLRVIRKGFAAAGETRPLFAYDAAGGLAPYLRGVARGWHWLPAFLRKWLGKILPGDPNPLKIARSLKTHVVSIGRLARPAHLDEIREAVRDRDYRPLSPVDFVIHWTINDREGFQQSFEAGVNAILTDKPDDLVAYLRERGVRVT